jgi:hypothetical protein
MTRLLSAILLAASLLLATPASAQVPEPNDPGYGDQWALPHIGAPCAWSVTTGRPEVSVAVIDSGVDLTHPDLVDRLRTDGADFVDGDEEPFDENGHGTNVAGIVAATLDNAEGIVGLAPNISILPVRVMNRKGFGSDRAIAAGVRFAADRGAQVINLSLGATLTIGAETESELVMAAIRYAQERGALVVVAAGNDFVPLPNAIVGDNLDVLVVAATDPDDRKADFSNSGPWITVSAPGVQILSTMPTYEVFLTSDEIPRDERFRQGYDWMSGTSQATPYVSALAALLFSARPDWTAVDVAQAIETSAATIADINPGIELGRGRIDACRALELAGAGQVPAPDPPLDEATPEPPLIEATPEPAIGEDGVPTDQPTESEIPTRVPEAELEPDEASVPGLAARALPIVAAAAGICGVTLLLVTLLLAARSARRPPRRAAPAPIPVYTPPPAPAAPPVAPPAAAGGWGSLTVVAGPSQQRSYPLIGTTTLVGRDPECQVMLIGDGTVSRRHVIIRNDGRQITVEDAGSTHGSLLNGQRLTTPAVVRRGDVLQVGQTLMRFG